MPTDKQNPGPKSTITPARVARLEVCFKNGMSVTDACYSTQVSRDAYYRRLKEDEEFRERMEYAKCFILTRAKQNVAIAIVNDGNIELSKWWIERKDPEFRLGAKTETEAYKPTGGIDESQALAMLAKIQQGIDARKKYHEMQERTWREKIEKAREIQAQYVAK